LCFVDHGPCSCPPGWHERLTAARASAGNEAGWKTGTGRLGNKEKSKGLGTVVAHRWARKRENTMQEDLAAEESYCRVVVVRLEGLPCMSWRNRRGRRAWLRPGESVAASSRPSGHPRLSEAVLQRAVVVRSSWASWIRSASSSVVVASPTLRAGCPSSWT